MGRNDMRTMIASLVSLFAAAGCGIEKPSGGAEGGAGVLQIALTASTPQGTTYRVEHATLDIFNSSGICASYPCVSVPGDDPTVAVDLTASANAFDYAISLEDGWTVSRVADDGSETPVAATLVHNFIPFTIKPSRTTPVAFEFQIGDQIATTGTGTVAVTSEFVEPLIDDFEDGDSQLAPFGGRDGQWVTFNDGSGVETPAPGAPALPQVVDTSANEVLHLTGSGFGTAGRLLPSGVFSYGAGVFANMVVDPTTGLGQPYNASSYSGVGFTFVMKTPPNAPVILAFYVQTSATIPIEQGGTCVFNCYDGFGVAGQVPYDPNGFTLSVVIPWEVMHQTGYGTPAVFDPTTFMSVNWLVSFADNGQPLSSNVFDLQIDDIAFAPDGFAEPSSGAVDAGGPAGPAPDAGGGDPDAGAADAIIAPPPPPPPPPGKATGPLSARFGVGSTWSWAK
jgi:hypothetical protein